MRLALARGVLWFFGAIIFFLFVGNEKLQDASDLEAFLTLIAFGGVVGGVVFGYTWYEHEQEERDLRREAAKRELGKKGDGCE